jgi:Zn2+/Cd2+-exporting ATPase
MNNDRSFLLKNLDCPNCAAKIEKKVSAIDGVKTASVIFVSKKLILSTDGTVEQSKIISEIEKTVKSVEPDIDFVETGKERKEDEKTEKGLSGELVRLILAATVFAVGVISAFLNMPKSALIIIFAACLVISGKDVFLKAVRNITTGQVFDENLLMTIAAIGAFAIGQFEESAAVLIFYQVGEFFQNLATDNSKKSISDLMNLRPDYANLKTDSGILKVSPADVTIGDVIEILPGERMPLDGVVLEGHSLVDTSGLTGEPTPREISQGDSVTGGFVNGDGLLTVKVEKDYGESTVAKIINLVENAGSKKAKAENFITKFARIYTPTVTGAALLIAVLPPILFAQPFSTWLYRAIIFLVVSCPCALVVSVPLGFFAGIGAASHNGILVKGGNFLEKLASVDTVVFDKTGTLTKGVFEVVDTVCAEGITSKELIETAALAQIMSNHPIAKSIIKAAGGESDRERVKDFSEIAGMGVIAVTDAGAIAAGNDKLMARENISYEKCPKEGTVVYVARDGKYLGCIIISDIIKSGAKKAIESIKSLGVKRTVMLTGDRESAAKAVAQAVGIDDVRAELMPDEKVSEFEKAVSGTHIAAYVGDGINDAPVLARADIGIAMGGIGSDAAVEAADIVIMDDDPSRLSTAIRISSYVRMIVRQNIAFALIVKFAVLILDTMGIVNIWAAVFADTGVALLAVLNSLRILIRRDKFKS